MRTIKEITRDSFLITINENISHFLGNGDNLFIRHDISSDKLVFTRVDNSKPYHYCAYENGKVVNKTFDQKVSCIAYKYPYIEEYHPAKMVASEYHMFGPVLEYKMIKEHVDKKPDYREVEAIINKAINQFKEIIAKSLQTENY